MFLTFPEVEDLAITHMISGSNDCQTALIFDIRHEHVSKVSQQGDFSDTIGFIEKNSEI